MESSGEALRIHVSPSTKAILDELKGYKLEYRGKVTLKGRGDVDTYWLEGKRGFKKSIKRPLESDGLPTVVIVPSFTTASACVNAEHGVVFDAGLLFLAGATRPLPVGCVHPVVNEAGLKLQNAFCFVHNIMTTASWEWPNGASEEQQTSVQHTSVFSIHAA
nr:unnamed protein product [Spirometra erinaceieuropaei]